MYFFEFVRIDSTEGPHRQGKCDLFMAIDRATKYVYVELHSKASVNESSAFLKNPIPHCPFKITKILTDNGAQFTYGLLALHLRPKRCARSIILNTDSPNSSILGSTFRSKSPIDPSNTTQKRLLFTKTSMS
ncbi:integrase core domain protein [Holospora obtusa F1]|uniref:Integrase core domain protein n=1 Tax=Holospora obtusa F1 TaxID=1399147 RepID=W6TF50_HOLOB|nr:integrase core domain protein [Holospora obtusa F1]